VGAGLALADDKDCEHGAQDSRAQMDGKHSRYGKHGHKQGEKMMRRMVKSLDLTEVQEDAIKDLMQAQYDGMYHEHNVMTQELKQLSQLDSGSDAYIAKAKEIGALQGESMAQRLIQRAGVQSQIMDFLTPEQVEQYQEMHNEMADH